MPYCPSRGGAPHHGSLPGETGGHEGGWNCGQDLLLWFPWEGWARHNKQIILNNFNGFGGIKSAP